jgi:ELWxxDGT repeat protein
VMVADINPGPEGSYPGSMTRAGSYVWFQATDPEHGMELWRSDGTVTGTQRITDLVAGSFGSSPLYLSSSGGSLFFSAFTDAYGREPWVIDVAPAVDSIAPSSGNADGGDSVTIHGWSFAPDATATIGGAPASQAVFDDRTLTAQSPPFAPGTLHDVVVRNNQTALQGVLPNGWFADFLDVPRTHPFHDFIEKFFRNGVTTGCGAGYYCVSSTVSRSQMAIFLLRSRYGGGYVPPAATGTIFADVPADAFGAAFIEEIYRQGVTGGCATNPLRFCPTDPVNRAAMSILLLRMHDGGSFVPPPATGIFADVPPSNFFAPWIEELYGRGITAGCATNPLRYCPANNVTRGEMAVFAVRTFALP